MILLADDTSAHAVPARSSAQRSARLSRSGFRSSAAARVSAAAKSCAPTQGARRGDGRRATGDGDRRDRDADRPDSRPSLDLVAPMLGFVGLLAASEFAGGPVRLAALRLVVGAAFLGAVSDAMLLGHWYLVQPGLRPRRAQGARASGPRRLAVRGRGVPVADGRGAGVQRLGRRRLQRAARLDVAVCAITTIGLVVLTWFALRERYYSAVMAATGLLYLAILTAFGTDLIARAVLAP